MRGIALKIFLSFWLVYAVMFAVFAILPDRGHRIRLTDHVRQNGLVASAILERRGAGACTELAQAIAERTHIQLALFDAQKKPVCRAEGVDLELFTPFEGDSNGRVRTTSSGTVALVRVHGPSGATFTAAGMLRPDDSVLPPFRPPFPYGPVVLAIVISGIVCFSVARYFARPLAQVRDVSYRLAAGDLQARVGSSVARRNDEIGDLVRDFDAMAGRIETLVDSQRQLLSDISHELRSPLARLNVALELARRKAGSDAQADLERIGREAERMNELIGHTLSLARAENRGATESGEPVDLTEIVRHVTDDAHYEAQRQQKGVAFRAAANPTVVGDPQLLASALDNVVRNAVRYTPNHTTVDVVVDAGAAEAIVTVRDRGPGVAAPELDRIFLPFHRTEAARNRETGGVGLGLAIAQRAIAVHKGSITAENVSDGGLRVTIRLPLAR